MEAINEPKFEANKKLLDSIDETNNKEQYSTLTFDVTTAVTSTAPTDPTANEKPINNEPITEAKEQQSTEVNATTITTTTSIKKANNTLTVTHDDHVEVGEQEKFASKEDLYADGGNGDGDGDKEEAEAVVAAVISQQNEDNLLKCEKKKSLSNSSLPTQKENNYSDVNSDVNSDAEEDDEEGEVTRNDISRRDDDDDGSDSSERTSSDSYSSFPAKGEDSNDAHSERDREGSEQEKERRVVDELSDNKENDQEKTRGQSSAPKQIEINGDKQSSKTEDEKEKGDISLISELADAENNHQSATDHCVIFEKQPRPDSQNFNDCDDDVSPGFIAQKILDMNSTPLREESPKVNGDHKILGETENGLGSAMDVSENKDDDDEDESSQRESTEPSTEDPEDEERNLTESSGEGGKLLDGETADTLPLTSNSIDDDDDNDDSSSVTSSSSSSSSSSFEHSQSSDHLVIDQPVEDGERSSRCSQPLSIEQGEESELESSLKRKTSRSSDADLMPPPKMLRRDAQGGNTEEKERRKSIEAFSQLDEASAKLKDTSETLQKFSPTPQLPDEISWTATNLFPIDHKFLCFNCRVGAFLTPEALNDHQIVCLSNRNLVIETKLRDEVIRPAVAASTPSPSPRIVIESTVEQRRYYKCSSCLTHHENWNFFLHLREKHNRYLCLYCVRLFPSAEKLSVHLEIKHDLEQNHYNTEEAFRKSIRHDDGMPSEKRFLMCCTCEHVFGDADPFSDHVCSDYMKPCTFCGLLGRHANQCKAHPDAKRSSKMKKKTKEKAATTSAADGAGQRLNLVPERPSVANNLCDTNGTDADPNPMLVAATPLPQPPLAPALNSEDSNSSSNMVIDESCSTGANAITSQSLFAAPGHPQLEGDTNRPDDSSLERMVVPKLKLRVPKEYQKPVDAVLSSSESGEEENSEEDDLGEAVAEGFTDAPPDPTTIHASPKTLPAEEEGNGLIDDTATEVPASQGVAEEEEEDSQVSGDDETADESQSNLERVLQEIERTKMDIKRTKESLSSSKGVMASPTSRNAEVETKNWSPTPPESPERKTSEGETTQLTTDAMEAVNNETIPKSIENDRDESSQVEHHLAVEPSERRVSAGSDAMDIDDTIANTAPAIEPEALNEKQTAEEECKKEENTEKMNTTSESSSSGIVDVTGTHYGAWEPNPPKEEAEKSEEFNENVEAAATLAHPNSNTEAANDRGSDHAESSEISKCSEEQAATEESEKKDASPRPPPSPPAPPSDGIEVASEESLVVDLQLDRPLGKFEIVEFIRVCLKAVYPLCLYCNHARRIAVNGHALVLHMIANHRFAAVVDSITAEELRPETIVAKLKSFLPLLENEYLNSNSYCTMGGGEYTHPFNERIFECFLCRFATSTHKELYLHNRRMHLKTAILCFMCRLNFFSFSEILCHICPGAQNKISVFDVKFRCCLCETTDIPSPFRLMVHLRKKHFACDVCLEDCRDQGKLSSHVWKHKLHHLCYRCGIAYRNKVDITKHLFWKHGTESSRCKRCMEKRWRHVYHFCVPPSTFVCDECTLSFSKAVYLKVHQRLHAGDLRYPCTEENCEEKFISRRLLLKHLQTHQVPAIEPPPPDEEEGKAEANGETMAEGWTDKERQEVTQPKEEKEEEAGIDQKMEVDDKENETKPKEPSDEKVSLGNEDVSEVKPDVNAEAEEKATESQVNDAEKIVDADGKKPSAGSKKKKKKHKRNKESLDDLNLTAPNLSESDSSDDSDGESKSSRNDGELFGKRVMLSPPSEADNDTEHGETKAGTAGEHEDPEKVMEIWKNFLQSQQTGSADEDTKKIEADYTEENYPTPERLHVILSDHDYCVMHRPPPPPPPPKKPTPSVDEHHRSGESESLATPEGLAEAAASTPAAKRRGSRSSSSSESSSSSDSSCSCGTNCSCSSSESESSSSSSSSGKSSSSGASNASRKRHHKKSERDRMRKKSESVSPLKKQNLSESINVEDVDGEENNMQAAAEERPPSPPQEPLFHESDLDTAESETDEEFYDEHPQKLANELFAQKRAELLARTRLSPSHHNDIVENSRPSTPSLPGDMTQQQQQQHTPKKTKLKKKKRDRKSSVKGGNFNASEENLQPPQQQLAPALNAVHRAAGGHDVSLIAPQPPAVYHHPAMVQPYELHPLRQPPALYHHASQLTPHTQLPHHQALAGQQPNALHPSRDFSEGSSCSEADGPLKRSKRQRRPNKFYGYTSDDENMGSGLGQPLMIGMRAFKPQPPPQLTWLKEDLPSPSKSFLNNKNKTPRTPKNSNAATSAVGGSQSAPSSRKRKRSTPASGGNKPTRKRTPKQTPNLPKIPKLKICPSLIGPTATGHPNNIPTSRTYTTSRESEESSDTSNYDDRQQHHHHQQQQQTGMMPPTAPVLNADGPSPSIAANPNQPSVSGHQLPPPRTPVHLPTPQATAFNHQIPPALLPNPDFATLQYFRANNIRYPIRPPDGARQARDGESVYCYCRCPYDEVSEMIACDGDNCLIEWFHFECVGIMVAPQGKWFCAECRPKYSEELYPRTATSK